MINGEQLVGKSVFTRSGQKLEPVRSVVLDATGKQIIALMIDGEGGKSDPRAISFEGIETIGPDAIMVAEGIRGLPPTSWPEVLNRLNEPAYQGREVMSASGDTWVISQTCALTNSRFTGRYSGANLYCRCGCDGR
jgi:uncharacterized protein YrrD